jgi:NADH:ubiquinone oxidoreductase subunit 6 (subunit J)
VITGPQMNKKLVGGRASGCADLCGSRFLLQGWSGFTKTAAAFPSEFDAMGALGEALVSPTAYVLPFEVASVLLLAALVGAVYLAFNKK